jgi:TonB-linked SusC/RagA family outer membrane protein
MNRNIIISTCLACFIAVSSISFAQTVENKTVDLGIGIPQGKNISTTSTVTITSEDLEKTVAINLQDALYGRLLGLTAFKNAGFSGDVGYGASFNIRGNQTSTENGVLILVDGFERPIDRLSVHEVESVTVLKDAAAVALYGYRGINGVILVKTKRSMSNILKVGVSYNHKFQTNPASTAFVDAPTYATALNEARTLDGLTPTYNQQEINAFKNGTYPKVYPNVDWKSQAMRNTATEDNATVTISGGSNRLKYFTVVDLVNATGLLNGTEINNGYSTQLKYSKANIRENIDLVLTPTTKMQVNLRSTFLETNQPNGINSGAIMSFVYNTPASAYPVLLSDGKTWGGTAASGANNIVARIQATGHNKTHERALFADAKITQDLNMFIKGLSASFRVGYDNRSQILETNSQAFKYGNKRYNFGANGQILDSTQYVAGSLSSNLSFGRSLSSQWRSSNFQAYVDYVKHFGAHNLSGSLIYTTSQIVNTGQYNLMNRANLSFSGHYDYSEKYVADLVVVGSGSNRSWPQKYALSPTLSVGWVLTKEEFLKTNDVINFMKLRASAGILHTDYVPMQGLSLENYSASAGWFTFGAGYGEQWGKFLSYFPTTDFALERAKKINLGLDTKLWNSLEITIEAYYQRRDNILQSAGALNTAVVGIPSSYINKGVVDSKGIEVGLNYNKTIGDVTVNVGALFTSGSNKIVDMVETPQAYAYLSRIGLPVWQTFGLQAIGLFKDQNDITNSPVQTFDRVQPGDIKYKDLNGDKRIDQNDMGPLKRSSPQINYSFNLGAEFKGFGFNVLVQGTGNATQYLSTQGVFNPLVNNSNLSTYYLENCWRPGQDNSKAIFPRLTSLASPNNYQTSSLWYANASFIKLRNCEVYYKLPKRILGSAHMDEVKLFVKGENLLSINKMPANMDPENMWGGYPILPAISVGASIKF